MATPAEPPLPPLRPIGIVRCTQVLHHDAPRQSGLGRGAPGTIELRQGLQNGLADLAGFSHVWVLFWCHLARGFRSQLVPPRDTRKRGVFATRAPQRPNPIGLSCVRLLRIEKRVLHIADHDLLDGTPVLDLKPYLRYCDSVPHATLGYVADLPPAGADHRVWWESKGVPPPAVYRRVRAAAGDEGGADRQPDQLR
ncbi:MAG: tRNA (N6-threonylcarbamoyladenosine(37)-N6)-methyltransferase TrmO [Planctomycetes bacterium]|nr:tRNA (N6-threonylcarbamoyladenosine(37)-N6)-methyltransferase TrmO [Planctomycetota bacterium]